MTPYQWLGAVSMALLAVAVGLSVYILTGKHSRKETYVVSASVLTLMVGITVMCLIIYSRFGK
ncbi:MAG: hypothetical protein V1798_01020 [Pseudomonadota bacterium]